MTARKGRSPEGSRFRQPVCRYQFVGATSKIESSPGSSVVGPLQMYIPKVWSNLKKVREQIFGLGRPAGHRAAAAGAFKKADPLGPKRLGSRESIHAGQSVPAPHLVPSRSLDRRLVCPGPRSGCPQRVRVRPGLINRAFGRCIGQRPDPLDEGQGRIHVRPCASS